MNQRPIGYAYFHSFHYPFRVWSLDYPFIRIGCLPSSLYTFSFYNELGSGLPFLTNCEKKVSPNLTDKHYEIALITALVNFSYFAIFPLWTVSYAEIHCQGNKNCFVPSPAKTNNIKVTRLRKFVDSKENKNWSIGLDEHAWDVVTRKILVHSHFIIPIRARKYLSSMSDLYQIEHRKQSRKKSNHAYSYVITAMQKNIILSWT